MAVAARPHMLTLPPAVLIIRYFQLATAVAVMGLAAYGITYLSFDGIDLTLFSALATIIISVYIIVATLAAPVMYNYWAMLGLDIFAIVFWVISFSYLAWEVATISSYYTSYTSYTCTYYYGYCIKKRDGDLTKRSTLLSTYRNSMAAAAGLGGLEFILFVITLVFTSVALHRHRKAGGHCVPQKAETPAPMQQQPVYVEQTNPPAQVYQPQPQPQPAQMYQPQPMQMYQAPVPQPQQPYTA